MVNITLYTFIVLFDCSNKGYNYNISQMYMRSGARYNIREGTAGYKNASASRAIRVYCTPPPRPSDTDGSNNKDATDYGQSLPDRRRLQEVRKINQERLKNLNGVLSTIKTYLDSELELRKSLAQEIVRIAKTDVTKLSLGKMDAKGCKDQKSDQDSASDKSDA